MTMFDEIENAKNKFLAKLTKIVANKEELNEEEITELLKTHQEYVYKILEFKYTSEDITRRAKITKELENIPCIAEDLIE